MSNYVFYLLAGLSIASALMVVFSKKPVHSVLYLIFCFFTIACHYVLLNAQFLAAVHVIVYAGAIMVLFLYTIMFLNMNLEIEPHKPNLIKAGAVAAGGLLMLVLVSALKSSEIITLRSSSSEIGLVKNLGHELYNKYMLPFEISALLFLAAMVGAVMIGKKEIN